jgi:hypothetical protein
MTPFAMTKPSQFRPQPPIALNSKDWAADYNEIRADGGKASTTRSPQQTETARFWLMVGPLAYHPVPRQIVMAKQMSVIDSARFMALFAVALTDPTSQCSTQNITTSSGGRSPQFATATPTATRILTSRRLGSRSTARPCTPNIRVRTASRAVRLRVSWKRCLAPGTFQKSR